MLRHVSKNWPLYVPLALLGSFVAFITYRELGYDEEYTKRIAAEKEAKLTKEAEDAKPRLVSSNGTCETWAFLPKGSGRWMYFARCDSKTTTYNQWEECRTVTSGKTSRTECEIKQRDIEQVPK